MIRFIKTNYIYLYYLVFVFIYIISAYVGIKVSMPIRFLFVGAMLVPAFKDKIWCPSVVAFSIILMRYGSGAGALFPTHDYFYLVICFIFFIYYLHSCQSYQFFSSLFVFLFYCCIIDGLIDGVVIRQILISVLITIICFQLFENHKESLAKFSFLLICATLALSISFIGLSQNFDLFIQDSFDKNIGESRSGWFDPNYFGTVLGMGSVAALIELYHKDNLSSFHKLLYIISFIVSVLALIKIASRGALISLLFASFVILYKSKIKLYFKLFICLLSVLFIFYLYNNNFMNIIVYRLENQGLETGRIDIWKDKLSAFSNLNIMNIIFGVGNSGVVDLGSERISMHNDFLSCLVQYGLIGFVIFIVLLFKPVYFIFKYGKRHIYTLTATIYLVTSLFTLNPITGGQTPYFLFVAYIYIIAKTYDGIDIPNKILKRLH